MSSINWLEKLQLPCIYKLITGNDCPGCGMQRAIISLFKGNILDSIKLFPPLIPVLFMLGFLVVHIIYKLKNGAKILVWMFIINVIIILLNFFYKLLIF